MVILYSNGCPRCKTVKSSLDTKKIPYEVISDHEEIMKVAKEHGELSLPFAMIDGEFYGSKALQKWVIAAKEEV